LKVKLDENLGSRAIELFRESGHEVSTVSEQNLGGASDDGLIEACRAEGRVLVTLDLDFSNVLRFPPERYAGIAVLRVPHPVELGAIRERA
jgi:predicted nuclease of predicted toxin-antitoxin system